MNICTHDPASRRRHADFTKRNIERQRKRERTSGSLAESWRAGVNKQVLQVPRSLYLTYATVAVAFLTSKSALTRAERTFSVSWSRTKSPEAPAERTLITFADRTITVRLILHASQTVFAGAHYVYRINSDARCIRAERQVYLVLRSSNTLASGMA